MITSEVIISLFKIWPYPEKPNYSKPIHFHWNIFILLNWNPDLGINFLANRFNIDWNPKNVYLNRILKCSIFFKIYKRFNLGVFVKTVNSPIVFSFHSPQEVANADFVRLHALRFTVLKPRDSCPLGIIRRIFPLKFERCVRKIMISSEWFSLSDWAALINMRSYLICIAYLIGADGCFCMRFLWWGVCFSSKLKLWWVAGEKPSGWQKGKYESSC